MSNGFPLSKSDSLLLIQQGWNGSVSILLYVDDLVIVSTDLEEIDRRKSLLAALLDMKDLGDLHYFLRIEVICTLEAY